MKEFIESFDFIRMKPDNSIMKLTNGKLNGFQVFAESGKQYAIYIEKGNSTEIELQIPDGEYIEELINPITGNKERTENLIVINGMVKLNFTEFQDDIAVQIVKKK